jgi:hypothetical protein
MTDAGVRLSRFVARQSPRRHGFARRALAGRASAGAHPDRNARFENITRLEAEYLAAGQPVIGTDTKEKELIGNVCRPGRSYATGAVSTFDHDFPSFADGGGSNPARSGLFKRDVQGLSERLGVEVRVAHYPPYCSKHNPVEHRVLPRVTRACAGAVFTDVPVVKRLVEQTRTRTGLAVSCGIVGTVCAVGRKAAKGVVKPLRPIRDELLPKWNHRRLPKPDG